MRPMCRGPAPSPVLDMVCQIRETSIAISLITCRLGVAMLLKIEDRMHHVIGSQSLNDRASEGYCPGYLLRGGSGKSVGLSWVFVRQR